MWTGTHQYGNALWSGDLSVCTQAAVHAVDRIHQHGAGIIISFTSLLFIFIIFTICNADIVYYTLLTLQSTFQELQLQIAAGQGAGLSGQGLWTTDIGGYNNGGRCCCSGRCTRK